MQEMDRQLAKVRKDEEKNRNYSNKPLFWSISEWQKGASKGPGAHDEMKGT